MELFTVAAPAQATACIQKLPLEFRASIHEWPALDKYFSIQNCLHLLLIKTLQCTAFNRNTVSHSKNTASKREQPQIKKYLLSLKIANFT